MTLIWCPQRKSTEKSVTSSNSGSGGGGSARVRDGSVRYSNDHNDDNDDDEEEGDDFEYGSDFENDV